MTQGLTSCRREGSSGDCGVSGGCSRVPPPQCCPLWTRSRLDGKFCFLPAPPTRYVSRGSAVRHAHDKVTWMASASVLCISAGDAMRSVAQGGMQRGAALSTCHTAKSPRRIAMRWCAGDALRSVADSGTQRSAACGAPRGAARGSRSPWDLAVQLRSEGHQLGD